MARWGPWLGISVALVVGVLVWAIAGAVRSTDGVDETCAAARARGAAPVVTDRSQGTAAPGDAAGSLRLAGRLVDADGAPVGGATVSISTEPPRTVTAGDDGTFAFDGLAPATYQLGALRGSDRAGPVLVRVREETEPVTLRVRAGVTLAVRVVDAETGAPIPGARVEAMRTTVASPEAITGPDGIAELRGVDPRFDVGFDVRAEGYTQNVIMGLWVLDRGVAHEATIALRPAPGVIAGTVLDPDGAPVAGASVLGAETDAAGAWRVTGFLVGAVSVVATAPGFAPSAPIVVDVDGAAPRQGVVLWLSPGEAISGIVVDEQRRPVVSAAIVAGLPLQPRAVTGPDGRFVLRGLDGELPVIFAAVGERASAPVRVVPGLGLAREVCLRLEDGTIAGVVVDAAGAPVADAQVRARRVDDLLLSGSVADLDAATVVTDARGRFELGPLPAGEYTIRVQPDGWTPSDRRPDPVHVRTGTRDARVVLPATGQITGVVTHRGVPAPVYTVVVAARESWLRGAVRRVVRAADGRFTLRDLPEGTWVVGIVIEGAPAVILRDVEVTAGEVTDVGPVGPAPGEAVRGEVRDAAGRPVAGATVRIGRPPAQDREVDLGLVDRWGEALDDEYTTTTDAAGRFAFETLRARQGLQARAEHPQLGRSPTTEVPPDGELALPLVPTGAIAGVVHGATARQPVVVEWIGPPGRSTETERTITDARGRFRIDGLLAGGYHVRVGDEGDRWTRPVEVEVGAGATAEVTLTRGRAAISLVVRTGRRRCRSLGLYPADVDALDPFDRAHAFAVCTRAGTTLDRVQPGDYRLCVHEGQDMTCRPVTVAPAPARQTVDVSGW